MKNNKKKKNKVKNNSRKPSIIKNIIRSIMKCLSGIFIAVIAGIILFNITKNCDNKENNNGKEINTPNYCSWPCIGGNSARTNATCSPSGIDYDFKSKIFATKIGQKPFKEIQMDDNCLLAINGGNRNNSLIIKASNAEPFGFQITAYDIDGEEKWFFPSSDNQIFEDVDVKQHTLLSTPIITENNQYIFFITTSGKNNKTLLWCLDLFGKYMSLSENIYPYLIIDRDITMQIVCSNNSLYLSNKQSIFKCTVDFNPLKVSKISEIFTINDKQDEEIVSSLSISANYMCFWTENVSTSIKYLNTLNVVSNKLIGNKKDIETYGFTDVSTIAIYDGYAYFTAERPNNNGNNPTSYVVSCQLVQNSVNERFSLQILKAYNSNLKPPCVNKKYLLTNDNENLYVGKGDGNEKIKSLSLINDTLSYYYNSNDNVKGSLEVSPILDGDTVIYHTPSNTFEGINIIESKNVISITKQNLINSIENYIKSEKGKSINYNINEPLLLPYPPLLFYNNIYMVTKEHLIKIEFEK